MIFEEPLSIRLKNGQIIERNQFNLVLTDDSNNHRVVAQLLPVTKPFILWSGMEYINIGDYTQAQAEARLLEILGNNPAQMLSIPEPTVYPQPSGI